ncbi:MAG: lytic transglycosylase domain-containing protein [Rickettsiales bacterium]
MKILLTLVLLFCSTDAWSEKCNAIKEALNKHWEKASICAKDKDTRAAVKWLKLRDSENKFTFKEAARFVYMYPHFPDIHRIILNAESKISHSVPKKDLSLWFRRHSPKSSNALKHYLRVLSGSDNRYKYIVRRTWVYGEFSPSELEDFYKKNKKYLRRIDTKNKINFLLRKGQKKIPSFLMHLVSMETQKIVNARLSLMQNKSNIASIINRVSPQYRSSHLLNHSKALWLKKRGHHHQLAKILIDNYKRPEFFSDFWSKTILILVSHLIDDGNYKLAYKIISNHNFKNVVNYVDGEWFAGKISYLYLQNYKHAFEHFHKLLSKSKFSTSRSKGAYWAARAQYRLGNQKKSIEYYKTASAYSDTFYGQLAAMKINKDKSVKANFKPEVTQSDVDWANKSDLVQISKMLANNKKHIFARKFISMASIRANSRGKRYLLTKLGSKTKLPGLSVVSGKEVARRGMFEAEHSYPVVNIRPSTKIESALVNAIIRQESEFDQYAKSSAGAMGLMQLIYPTAKYVSNKLKQYFNKRTLMSNKVLNVRFGSYYLSELIDRYKGSYVLAIAAYNAGPSNVDKWIKRFGDPRKTKDYNAVVGWIEKIPYYETRTYVQNVLSNLQIYRSKLRKNKGGKIRINLDTDLVRATKRKLV